MIRRGGIALSLHEHAIELPSSSIDRPQRLVNAMEAVGGCGTLSLPRRRATLEELALVHDRGYLEGLRAACEVGFEVHLDPELVLYPNSFAAACAASGALIEAVDRGNDLTVPLCLSRPGSHHAGRDYGLGFCIVNHLAVAAAWALASGRAERIAVFDFDAHHGNGTEQIFAAEPNVLTVSLHQYPFFPGSGAASSAGDDRSADAGAVANLNLPLAEGDGHKQACAAIAAACAAIRDFEPDLLLVEAGVDAHASDWTTGLRFEDRTFYELGIRLAEFRDGCRMVMEMGGGYTKEAVLGGLSSLLDGMLR